MLGEIPGSTVTDVYYHLSDLNDASGNGRTLIDKNTVSFVAGKFTNGADFGSSGTNKALWYTSSNILGSTTPTNVLISFWFKLNTTGSSNTNANFVIINTNVAATTGSLYNVFYNISGSNITVSAINYNTAGDTRVDITTTADSNWHHVYVINQGRNVSISIDRGVASVNNTGSGSARSVIDANSVYLTIGNSRLLTTSAWAIIDELFISDGLYSGSSDIDRTSRLNYYTQAKGRFCI